MNDQCPFMGLKPSFGHDSDLEESEQLVNLGSTALRELDDFSDDGSSEDRMTLQDDFSNINSQNTE